MIHARTMTFDRPATRLSGCAHLVMLCAVLLPGVLAAAASAAPLPPVQAVASGGSHALALAKDGTVWAWGARDVGAPEWGRGLCWAMAVQMAA